MVKIGKYYIDMEVWKMGASGIIGILFALAAIAGNKYLEQTGTISGANASLFSFTFFMIFSIVAVILLGIRKRPAIKQPKKTSGRQHSDHYLEISGWFFVIGIILIIIATAGFFDTNNLNNKLAQLNRALDSLDFNEVRSISNLDTAIAYRNTRTVLEALNITDERIEKLKDGQRFYMMHALAGKYLSIYGKPVPNEEWQKWAIMNFSDLEDLNNKVFLPQFIEKEITIVEERNSLEENLNFRNLLYPTLNVIGLLFVFIANRIEKHKLIH